MNYWLTKFETRHGHGDKLKGGKISILFMTFTAWFYFMYVKGSGVGGGGDGDVSYFI